MSDEDQVLDEATKEEVKQRLVRHVSILSQYEDIQGAIDELTDDPKDTIEYREQFEAEYYSTIKTANQLLSQGQPSGLVPLSNAESQQPSVQQSGNIITDRVQQLSVQATMQSSSQLNSSL